MLCAVIATAGGILIASVSGVSMLLSELVMIVLAVVLIGGMDSLTGCIIGGLILSIGQNLTSYYLSPYSPGIESVFSMILILIVLMVRPSGLLCRVPAGKGIVRSGVAGDLCGNHQPDPAPTQVG